MLKRIYTSIDKLNSAVGSAVSWLSLILVLVIVLDVSMRYIFNWSSPLTFEIEWHIFSALFLLTFGWTLNQDNHVRVDVFYHRFSKRNQSLTNLFGSLFLLIPFCVVGFWESLPFVFTSFKLMETSTDPGGLPARFLIKSAIPIGFLLLGLQGISLVISSTLKVLKKP